jgi:fibronectin type 3 domain-containing protein
MKSPVWFLWVAKIIECRPFHSAPSAKERPFPLGWGEGRSCPAPAPFGPLSPLVTLCSLCLLTCLSLSGAPSDKTTKPAAPGGAQELFGPHHLVRSTRQIVSGGNGPRVEKAAEYVEVQTGLFYREGEGWRKSREEIELREGHALAYQGPHRVIFLANINRIGAIYLTDASGKEFRSHVLGLSYFDAASGKSVMISEVKDSIAELLPPNQLVYRNALADLKADIRFTYTKAGLEQDVILHELPPAPQEYGLDPETTRLEVLTEFMASPQPVITQKKLKVEKDAQRRAAMVEADSVDEKLDFGNLVIGLGKAFYTRGMEEEMPKADPANGKGAKAGPPSGRRSIPVAKRWLKMEERQVLVEAVEYKDLKANLELDLKEAKPGKKAVSLWRVLPQLKPGTSEQETITVAQVPYRPRGLVLDYYMVNTTADFTFRSGVTYHINGEVYLSRTTRLEEEAVLKLAPGASVRVLGSFQSPARKAYLTADHDHGIGVSVPARQANLTGGPALSFHNLETGTAIKNLELRYAGVGIENYSPQAAHTVEDCTFFKCDTALEAFGASVTLKNPRLTEVKTAHRNLGGGAEISTSNVLTTQAKAAASPQVRLASYDDHGNGMGSASYIGPNGGMSGSIDYGGDEDYFRLDVSSSGTLTAYSAGSTDTVGSLLDAWGNSLAYSDDNPYPNFNFSYAVNPGTYYIVVRHYSYYATGSYSVYTSFSPSYSDDHGNSTGSATYMGVNGSVGGTINYSGDEDYFQFYLSSGGTVTAYSTGSTDTYGYLLDSWGNTLSSNDDNPYPNFNFSSTVSAGGYYYVRVRHYSYYGTGSYTLSVVFSPAAPPPQTPYGLSVIASSQMAQTYLSWSSSYLATGYRIKRSTSSSGPFNTIATTSGTYSTAFYDNTVAWGTTYYYVVSAENSAGESGNSYVVSVATAPYSPSGVVAYGGSGYVWVSWNAASGASSYYVKRSSTSGGPYATILNTASTAYTDTYNISPGTTYYYVISAWSYSGAESYNSSQASAITAPPAPTGLSASGGNQQISLSWSAATGASSYNIRRSTSSGGPFNQIASGISGTSYTDTGLAANTTYYYIVEASNSGGVSSMSNQASATTTSSPPPTPSGLAASGGSGQIYLSWNSSAGASSYSVKRWNGSYYATINTTGSTSYTDSGLSANTPYYYVVSASNSSGSSADSSSAGATTAPPTPSSVSAWGGNGQVSLSWSASAGASSYRLQRSTGGSYSTISFPSSASFTDTGLAGGTTYYYLISALNSSGAESSSAGPVGATTLPSTPSGLNASPGVGQVSLSWNGVSGASGYYLKRLSGSGGNTVATYALSGTSYTETGLASATTYYYVVSAYNGTGESGASAQAWATTAPGAPSGLNASPSANQVSLSWSGTAGASYYRVKRSTTSGGPYSTVASPSATSYADSGLSTGVTYHYVISAVNGSGLEGPNSGQISVTTVNNDSDGDGLPDTWEQQYFGTLSHNGSGDYDGDGVSNLQEYQSGTNPAVVNATVRIARPRSGSNFP